MRYVLLLAVIFFIAIARLSLASELDETESSPIRCIGHERNVYSVVLTPDGKFAVSGGEDPYLIVWNTETGKEAQRILRHGPRDKAGPAYNLEVSPDGTQVAALAPGQRVQFWEIATGKESDESYPLDAPTIKWALSNNRTKLARSGFQDVSIEDVGSGAMIWETEYPARDVGYVTALSFSPDSKRIVIGLSYSGGRRINQQTDRVQVVDLDRKKVEFTSWPGTPPDVSASFSPNGKLLAAGSATLQVWESNSFATLFAKSPKDTSIPKHFPITCLTFKSSNSQIVTGGSDGSVVVWNASDGNVVGTFKSNSENIRAVSSSKDEKKLAAACADKSILVWSFD